MHTINIKFQQKNNTINIKINKILGILPTSKYWITEYSISGARPLKMGKLTNSCGFSVIGFCFCFLHLLQISLDEN